MFKNTNFSYFSSVKRNLNKKTPLKENEFFNNLINIYLVRQNII